MGGNSEHGQRLRLERVLPAPPEAVFDAWTDPQSVRRFLCPVPATVSVAHLDVRVGGQFRIVMSVGEADLEHTGEYRLIERPRRLVFTWLSKATWHRSTVVTLDLFPHGEQATRLVLTQEALPDEEAAHGHNQGWTSILEKLAGLLQRGGETDE